jgi:photosystem II stability/assembly factor-like uncharacterized protein
MRYLKILAILLPVVLLAQSCSLGGLSGGGAAGGVIKSVDSGESFTNSGKLATGMELTGASIGRLRIDNLLTDNLYLASPSNGVYQSLDRAATWKNILTGPQIYDLQINPKDSEELIAGGKVNALAKIFKSTDQGKSWVEIYSESKTGAYVSALAYFPNSPKTIWAGLSTGEVIQSLNAGVSWNLLSKVTGRILEFEMLPATGIIKALSMTGGLNVSKDNGATWNVISTKVPVASFQDFVSPSSNNAGAYLATYDGLYRTADSGGNWQKLQLPLHEGGNTVSAVTVDQKNNNVVYAVIARTMYKSVDAGVSWQTHILPTTASVRMLTIDPNESNLIYAALGAVLQ